MQTALEVPRGQRRPERILFLAYFEPRSVPTIESNIAFYQQHSEYQVLVLNLAEHRADSGPLKIPQHIALSDFDAVIIHNTVGYSAHNLVSLDAVLDEKLRDFPGAKIILKQDEHHLFNAFAAYAAEVGFDRIFTVMPESEWRKTYGKLLPGVMLCPMLTGYIMPWQRQAPDLSAPRPVDIGYRGSIMPLSFGRLCYDKRRIGDEVISRLGGGDLVLDISSAWEDRIGGNGWHTFLSSCKAVLGVESGAGIFDFDGTLDETCRRIEADLGIDDGTHEYAEAYLAALGELDGAVRYYALSPRHFEAIAAGAIQVLLPGHFSGRMQAGRHYFELAPDYSNLEAAVSLLSDDAARTEMAQCAFDEVVLDPANWIETFASELDGALTACLAEKPRPARAETFEYQAASPEAAHNIVILQAHQFGIDPRRDSWYAAGAPEGMIFHGIGVATDTPTAEITDASGKLAVEAPRLLWHTGCLDALARQLATDASASAVIRELYFLDYARKLSDTELFTLFGFPKGEQMRTFRWFIGYLLNNALTLTNALSNARNVHGIVAINFPSLPPAILMGRLYNVPVIYEALEYWPEADPGQCDAMYHFWKNFESRIAPMADLHGTVSPQLAGRMTHEFGTRFDAVPNVVPLADALVPARGPAIAPGDGRVRFLYQGSFAKHRGLEELISCWGDADPRAHLYLRGPGNDYCETLRTLAQDLDCLDRNVHFIDPVPTADLIAAARADADVGIIPYAPVNANYAACSPNKMGQYFAAGVPILANRTAFVTQTVTGANAGQVVDFSRRGQLLAAISRLCDAEARRQHARNARTHFETEFHWEAQSAGFYSKILHALEQRSLTPASSFALSMLRSLPELEVEFESGHAPAELPPRRRRSLPERLSRSIRKRWRWLMGGPEPVELSPRQRRSLPHRLSRSIWKRWRWLTGGPEPAELPPRRRRSLPERLSRSIRKRWRWLTGQKPDEPSGRGKRTDQRGTRQEPDTRMRYAFPDGELPPSTAGVVHARIPSLDDTLVEHVISTRNIGPALTTCRDEVRAALGFPVTADEVTFCIANTIAHQFRPYGDHNAMSWDEIVQAPTLNCGNYPILLHYLLPPRLRAKIKHVGFHGGVIGNHAQVYVAADGQENRPMILDPTTSGIAFIDFDSLLMGKLPSKPVYSLNRRHDSKLTSFYDNVDNALSSGKYKPTDLLFYCFSLEIHTGDENWPFRTPGGEVLYQQQKE